MLIFPLILPAIQIYLVKTAIKGKVVKSGTHQQLLAKGASYAHSWQLQLEAEEALS